MSSYNLFVCAALLVATVAQVKSEHEISCYECDSQLNKGCGASFDFSKNKQIHCNKESQFARLGNLTVCYKRETTVNGKPWYTRKCALPNDDLSQPVGCTETIQTVYGASVPVKICTCESDGCNAAPRQIRSGFVSHIGVHITLLLFFAVILL